MRVFSFDISWKKSGWFFCFYYLICLVYKFALMLYLNNFENDNHIEKYGQRAVFDVSSIPTYSSIVRYVEKECVKGSVRALKVSRTFSRQLQFELYEITGVKKSPLNSEQKICYVFYGNILNTHTKSKKDALNDERTNYFFDVNGNFKRRSLLLNL